MAARKSYLIIGRLPTSALFTSIQSKHDITHVPTKDLKRADVIARISQLSQKSYTFALLVSETQHIYPIDETLMGTITVECLCKVGAGFDPIDVDYFTSKGTWVANAPNAVRIPTAEWCVALILATVKGIGVADRHVRRGLWRSELGFQSNIQGMSLGIVGLGAIGKEVVKRMSGWGVQVLYSNRTPLAPEEEKELCNARHVPLSELFARSDIISLHCPLTPETRHLINRTTLSQCKKGVYIINTSRGAVVDEVALVEGLKTGQVRRAGLDVFEREPQVEKELLEMDNVVLSPHYAAFTNECMSDLGDEVLQNSLAYISTGKPNTPVNRPPANL